MKILIVSDTHRRDGNLREIIEKQSPFDMLIHLGDTEGSEVNFKEWVNNDNCVIHVVRGNNDFFSQTDREKEISIGKYRAFLELQALDPSVTPEEVQKMTMREIRERMVLPHILV